MSESLAVGRAGRPPPPAGRHHRRAAALDPRRKLQLGPRRHLGAGRHPAVPAVHVHQELPDMLAGSAHGNPGVVAAPITWSANLIDHHVVVLNALFATVQLALGLGIAWRPTLRLALAASIAWSLAVWWLGEGFGGILAGTASPVNGAPGPVILYAVLAACSGPPTATLARPPWPNASSAAARPRPPGSSSGAAWPRSPCCPFPRPRAISDVLTDGADGAPAWLAWIDTHAASALNHHGLAASIVLAVLLALVAAAVYLSAPVLRARHRAGRRPGRGAVAGPGHGRALHRHGHRPRIRPPARPAGPGLLARHPTAPQPRRPDMGGPAWFTTSSRPRASPSPSTAPAAWPPPAAGTVRPNSTPTAPTWSWAWPWPGCSSPACVPCPARSGKSSSPRARPGRLPDAPGPPRRPAEPLALLPPPAAPGRVRRHGLHVPDPARLGRGQGHLRRHDHDRDGVPLLVLTLPLALFLFGYVVWLGDRVTLHAPALALATAPAGSNSGHGSGNPSPAPAQSYLAPRCAAICKSPWASPWATC